METNVRLHVGKDTKTILVNKKAVRNLRLFYFTTEPRLITMWEYVGNGPKYVDAPDDIYSNESYPLRFELNEDGSVQVILLSRPLSGFKNIQVTLVADAKDLIRFTFPRPIHQDIIDTLVSLGVEVDMQGEPVQ